MNKHKIHRLYRFFLKNGGRIYNDNSWVEDGGYRNKDNDTFFLKYNCSEEDPPLLTKQEVGDLY